MKKLSEIEYYKQEMGVTQNLASSTIIRIIKLKFLHDVWFEKKVKKKHFLGELQTVLVCSLLVT